MTQTEIKEKYPFLYETHMHTYEASKCAVCSGADMAWAYKEHGYAGIIVTDHNWGGNTRIDPDLPWEEWVEQFFAGYRNAKEAGDKIGLDVFPAWEAGYHGPEFLIYGMTPEWVKKHPELKDATVAQQYQLVHADNGLVIQAHPYREEWYIDKVRLFPDDVDGVEIVNATHSNHKSTSHNNPVFDERAIEYAKEHHFMTTAGSDMHSTSLFGGGMAFPTKLESMDDFVKRIRNREDYVVTNGDHWYTKDGDLLV